MWMRHKSIDTQNSHTEFEFIKSRTIIRALGNVDGNGGGGRNGNGLCFSQEKHISFPKNTLKTKRNEHNTNTQNVQQKHSNNDSDKNRMSTRLENFISIIFYLLLIENSCSYTVLNFAKENHCCCLLPFLVYILGTFFMRVRVTSHVDNNKNQT